MHQHQQHTPADLGAQWDRFQQPQQGPAQWHQPQQQPQQQSGWADSFGKGKGREMSPMPMEQQQYQPQMGMGGMPFGGGAMQTYQPRLQPMYQQQLQQPAPLQAGHAEMEAAFERALADARAQTAPEEAKEEVKEDAAKVDEVKEDEHTEADFKGELDAVWESLKPEAERLNKLAEWEKEFSQVGGGGRLGVGVGRVKEGVGVRIPPEEAITEDVDMFQEWKELLLERERDLTRMMATRSRSSSISAASDQLRPMTTSPPPMRNVYDSDSDPQCSCSSCELGLVENTLSSSSLPLSYSKRTLQRGEVRSCGGWFSHKRPTILVVCAQLTFSPVCRWRGRHVWDPRRVAQPR
jgi:peroxin-5